MFQLLQMLIQIENTISIESEDPFISLAKSEYLSDENFTFLEN